MKLHLGCGQYYLEGYVNIDYPMTEHTVQQKSVADKQQDLLTLKYADGTIDEVRLHHVFEHFSRAQACSMLASWNSWLKQGGVLHIEVPDFERTARNVLRFFSNDKTRSVGLRHIFGSQEAHWAVHYEGYTKERLKRFLELFGFKTKNVKQARYLDTFNLEIIAEKNRLLNKSECRLAARQYLSGFRVADVESEKKLLDTWMDDFDKQLTRSYSGNG